MIWKVKEAQDKFQELIGAADTEPQAIYLRVVAWGLGRWHNT